MTPREQLAALAERMAKRHSDMAAAVGELAAIVEALLPAEPTHEHQYNGAGLCRCELPTRFVDRDGDEIEIDARPGGRVRVLVANTVTNPGGIANCDIEPGNVGAFVAAVLRAATGR